MENYKPDQALACIAAALECGLGLGLCGVVLGDALIGVANMLMRLSIIEMDRYERLETGYCPSNPTVNNFCQLDCSKKAPVH